MAISAKLKSPHIKGISLNNPCKENRHRLVVFVVICTLVEIIRLDIISAVFLDKKGLRRLSSKAEPKLTLRTR